MAKQIGIKFLRTAGLKGQCRHWCGTPKGGKGKGMVTNNFFPEIQGNLGFGCMRLPMNGEEVNYPEFIKMVDAFMAEGFHYFDTAHGYLNGRSAVFADE